MSLVHAQRWRSPTDFYLAANEMLRHYSASRIGVLSVTLPVCVAILGFSLTPGLFLSTRLFLAGCEVVLFAFAALICLYFGYKYEQTRRYIVRLESGHDDAFYTYLPRIKNVPWVDGVNWGIIAVGVTLHVAYLIVFMDCMFSNEQIEALLFWRNDV